MDTTERIQNAIEWANKRLTLQGQELSQKQKNYLTFALSQNFTDNNQALQLQQTGVGGCFSYKEALEFLQLHTPIAVKPIKKSKYKFVQPFTSKNARDIVIFSLATELSKNNR